MSTERNVPKLRFPGFTEPWEQRKLGDLVDRVTRKNQDLVSELPLTISAQYGLIDQNEFFDKRVASKDVSGYYLIENGEFAYNKSTSTDAPWGAIKRLDRYENGVLSTLYIIFGIKENNPVDSDFLVSYYSTNLWHKGIHEIAAEGARNHGLLNIAPADFFETRLMIPQDIEEQKKIGKYFIELEALITLHQRKLKHVKDLKKSMLQKMFPKNGQEYPELRFPGFTEPWEQRKLGATNTFFTDGNYGEAYPKSSDMTDSGSGIPFLTGGNLKDGKLSLDGASYITPEKHSKLTSGHLLEDDIVIAVRGSLGALGYVNTDNSGWNINSQLAILRTDKSELYGKFLIQYLLSWTGQNELLKRQTGSALKQLPIGAIKDVEVPITSIAEQGKIGEYFADLDNLITLHQRELEHFKLLKKGMLQQMFV